MNPTEEPSEDQRITDPKQELLFDVPPDWKNYWKGMPGFEHVDLEPVRTIYVHFKDQQDIQKFARLLNQPLTDETKSIWYPKVEVVGYTDKRWVTTEPIMPKYPIYVISKGRWENRPTSRALERIKVPYSIVVEPQEYEQYAAVVDPKKIIVTPFANLGQGSIPVRNFVWEHAKTTGAERHWILDDNIYAFGRFQNNLKVPVTDGVAFRAIEDFVDRYENVAISGMQYWMFILRKHARYSPVRWNTRVYSCILIKNDLTYRWRGRYNEDTDLSIRALKDGWCTALFNAFFAEKATTMTMKGGNTDELYKEDGRLKMAESLRDQHPDIVRITKKWGRWQHHVNYTGFKYNKPLLKRGVTLSDELNDYGMSMKILDKPQSVRGFNQGEQNEAVKIGAGCDTPQSNVETPTGWPEDVRDEVAETGFSKIPEFDDSFVLESE